ncbi:MAG: 30S ribosomal protein S18 [Bdellovibrionota bacterium]
MEERRDRDRDRDSRGDRMGDMGGDMGGRGGRGGPGGKGGRGGPGGRRFGRRKVCRFCAEKVHYIDWKEVRILRSFVTEEGKIIPRRTTGNCSAHQRKLTRAIRRARTMALIPVAANHHR